MLLTGLMGVAATVCTYGIWKWVLLGAGIVLCALGIRAFFRNPTGLDRDGRVVNQAVLNKLIVRTLQSHYQNPGMPAEAAPCSEDDAMRDERGATTESIPLSLFLPPVTRRKFMNGMAVEVPVETGPIHIGKTLLFTVPLILLDLALYASWANNIAHSFFRVLFTASSLLLGVLILTWHPITRTGKACLTLFCLFLAVQTGMAAYTNYVMPKYIEVAYQTETIDQSGDEHRLFIVREYENGSPKIIYATPGLPTSCAYYAIAEADVPYDTAEYGKIKHLEARAYCCDCVIYDLATREPLTTINIRRLFPSSISENEKRDFHPHNDQIIEQTLTWVKQNPGQP